MNSSEPVIVGDSVVQNYRPWRPLFGYPKVTIGFSSGGPIVILSDIGIEMTNCLPFFLSQRKITKTLNLTCNVHL